MYVQEADRICINHNKRAYLGPTKTAQTSAMDDYVLTLVVQNSGLLSSAFIATLDHLPCDVIRSLWLIQACNIQLNRHKERLDGLLRLLQNGELAQKDVIPELIEVNEKIRVLGLESTAEARALHNQLVDHRLTLDEEVLQLREIQAAFSSTAQDNAENEKLRAQLQKHYKLHPLKSQLEAIEEQEHLKKQPGREKKLSGLKLVLKIRPKPKSAKVAAPKTKALKVRKPVNKPEPVFVPAEPASAEDDEDNKVYCFCKQRSLGDMIGCDNDKSCPNGDWFHYKCVGLLNRVDALKYSTGKQKWFCSDYCRDKVLGNNLGSSATKKKKKRRRY